MKTTFQQSIERIEYASFAKGFRHGCPLLEVPEQLIKKAFLAWRKQRDEEIKKARRHTV